MRCLGVVTTPSKDICQPNNQQ